MQDLRGLVGGPRVCDFCCCLGFDAGICGPRVRCGVKRVLVGSGSRSIVRALVVVEHREWSWWGARVVTVAPQATRSNLPFDSVVEAGHVPEGLDWRSRARIRGAPEIKLHVLLPVELFSRPVIIIPPASRSVPPVGIFWVWEMCEDQAGPVRAGFRHSSPATDRPACAANATPALSHGPQRLRGYELFGGEGGGRAPGTGEFRGVWSGVRRHRCRRGFRRFRADLLTWRERVVHRRFRRRNCVMIRMVFTGVGRPCAKSRPADFICRLRS